MSRSSNWCFTLNNPDDNWHVGPTKHKNVAYLIGGTETSSTGTKHIQGFIQLTVRSRLSVLKKILPAAHFEVMMGNSKQAQDYCKKGDQPHDEWKLDGVTGSRFGENASLFEFGTWIDVARTGGRQCPDKSRSNGQKGGMAKAEEWKRRIALAEKGDMDTFKEEFPGTYFLHYNTVKRIGMDNPRHFAPLPFFDNEWIWGPPGTGKSLTARTDNPDAFIKSLNKDWSGYRYETVVILDDVGSYHFQNGMGDHLKRWADHYPFPVDIKYSGANIRPKRIIVTSNYSIETLCGADSELCEAITRRFKVRHFVTLHKFDSSTVSAPKTPFNSTLIYPPEDHGVLPSDSPFTFTPSNTPSQAQDCSNCYEKFCTCFATQNDSSDEEVPDETCEREDLY